MTDNARAMLLTEQTLALIGAIINGDPDLPPLPDYQTAGELFGGLDGLCRTVLFSHGIDQLSDQTKNDKIWATLDIREDATPATILVMRMITAVANKDHSDIIPLYMGAPPEVADEALCDLFVMAARHYKYAVDNKLIPGIK